LLFREDHHPSSSQMCCSTRRLNFQDREPDGIGCAREGVLDFRVTAQ
jgi:hypothetical protein